MVTCVFAAGLFPMFMQGQAANISEQYLLAAANAERHVIGLPELRWNERLTQAARFHAREMAARHTISHQFAGEPDLASRAGQAGTRFSLVTENVAEASTSATIHRLWMQSEGHRANLLDPHVDSIGIAVVFNGGQLYAVEDFSETVRWLAPADQESAVAGLLEHSGLEVEAGLEDARRTCLRSTGYDGPRKPWYIMRYSTSDLSRLPSELSSKIASGRYKSAVVGACASQEDGPFSSYHLAVLLYP